MKKMLWIVLAGLLLTGCSQAPAAETVMDVLEEPVLAQPREVRLELPGETVACAMESDSGRLYLGDGYEVMVQTLPGGDLDATIRSLTGFSREDITVMQTGELTCDAEDGVGTFKVWSTVDRTIGLFFLAEDAESWELLSCNLGDVIEGEFEASGTYAIVVGW